MNCDEENHDLRQRLQRLETVVAGAFGALADIQAQSLLRNNLSERSAALTETGARVRRFRATLAAPRQLQLDQMMMERQDALRREREAQ